MTQKQATENSVQKTNPPTNVCCAIPKQTQSISGTNIQEIAFGSVLPIGITAVGFLANARAE
jgi:hypothetical protein